MTLLDHVVLQVDDLNAIGDWYDQVVSLAGGTRTFDTPNLIGYALPGQPAQLFFSLATDPGGRQTHLALRVEDETTVRLVHEFATARGAEILHEPRLWPEYAPDYYAVFIRDPAGNNLELKCQASTARPTLSTQPISRQDPHSPTDPDTTEEHAS
jgi:catechol 2,3-dioxygenase-like lactoylglutathione lyase family enzyme